MEGAPKGSTPIILVLGDSALNTEDIPEDNTATHRQEQIINPHL